MAITYGIFGPKALQLRSLFDLFHFLESIVIGESFVDGTNVWCIQFLMNSVMVAQYKDFIPPIPQFENAVTFFIMLENL